MLFHYCSFTKNIGFCRFRDLLIRSLVTPTSARRNHEPRWRRKTYSAAHFKDKFPTTRKRKCLRSNKIFSLLRDVKITKAQSITTHISNTQLYFTAFRRQLSTKRLNNNDGVKFFCRKFSKKIHQVIMKRGNRNNNCPLLSCLRQEFVNNENFIPRGYCCTTNPYCITNYALDV